MNRHGAVEIGLGRPHLDRNAQRLASNYSSNVALPPGGPGGGAVFLYSGMGDSTFRVNGGTDTLTGFGLLNINQIFALDNPAIVGSPNLVDATFEANGVFNGNLFGELPFGWGAIRPGESGAVNNP